MSFANPDNVTDLITTFQYADYGMENQLFPLILLLIYGIAFLTSKRRNDLSVSMVIAGTVTFFATLIFAMMNLVTSTTFFISLFALIIGVIFAFFSKQ